jgi:hypothetical protein
MKKLNLAVWIPAALLLVCGVMAYRVWRMLPTGDAVAATTPIPGSAYEVKLLGPDMKGHYWYEVVKKPTGQQVARRFVGGAYFKRTPGDGPQDAIVPSVAREESDGVWRITWGKEGGDASKTRFALIDVKKRVVLQDSNTANFTATPFADAGEVKAKE